MSKRVWSVYTDCAVTVTGSNGVFNSSFAKGSIYPNPSTGALTIEASAGADVIVYNVTGKVVFRKANIDNNELIDADLTKGMYFVSVTKDNNKEVVKLIIE